MNAKELKTCEAKARRRLAKQGYILKKSRIRNTNSDDYGGYMIVNADFNIIEAGEKFELAIEDVESFIKDGDNNNEKNQC